MDCWNDFTKEWVRNLPESMTINQLCNSGRYWTVSPAQLARDLKPRTLKAIYSENAAGRRYHRCKKNCVSANEYLRWCQERGHTPHPASIDPDHPIARQREGMRFVKRG